MHEVLKRLLTGQPMSVDEARATFASVLAGEADPAQIAALLSLMAARTSSTEQGPSVSELVGGARAMRAHVTRVQTWEGAPPLIDTCGTGGAPKTFNVSTISAIVVAAAAPGQVLVAKHGGLSRTGRGSAELLRALGVNILASPEIQTRCLRELGLCFSFAVQHHPAMKHAAPVRKSLGFPTIFNLLGPLSNPAGATRQLIGVYHPDLALKVARALAELGTEHTLVVHSADGLDELTTTAPTTIHEIHSGRVSTTVLKPEAVGLARARLADLAVDSLDEAVAVARDVLTSRPGPRRDIVVLNSGAALMVAGVSTNIADGMTRALAALEQGRAAQLLERLATLSHEPCS
jgi:anthranilate phosphoribosyltransferase